MPAIIEFIVGILYNMTLVKFNIISNQFAKVLERTVKLCLISQKGQCFVREIDTNKNSKKI